MTNPTKRDGAVGVYGAEEALDEAEEEVKEIGTMRREEKEDKGTNLEESPRQILER